MLSAIDMVPAATSTTVSKWMRSLTSGTSYGVVSHSSFLGGCAAGWLYAHLLGYGRPSFVQRALRRRRLESNRRRQMSLEEFIVEEIDPLLEKISRSGVESLTRSERRTLAQVREKMPEPPQ